MKSVLFSLTLMLVSTLAFAGGNPRELNETDPVDVIDPIYHTEGSFWRNKIQVQTSIARGADPTIDPRDPRADEQNYIFCVFRTLPLPVIDLVTGKNIDIDGYHISRGEFSRYLNGGTDESGRDCPGYVNEAKKHVPMIVHYTMQIIHRTWTTWNPYAPTPECVRDHVLLYRQVVEGLVNDTTVNVDDYASDSSVQMRPEILQMYKQAKKEETLDNSVCEQLFNMTLPKKHK